MGVQLRFGIGGIGGSGTRLVSRMVQELDFCSSNDQNESLDDLLFTTLFKTLKVFEPEFQLAEKYRFFCHCREKTGSLDWDEGQVIDWLGQNGWASEQWIAERFRFASVAENQRPWFWKEPNTHFIIDKLLALDPDLKYIHVVRNVFDMALSRNQNQFRFWGQKLLEHSMPDEPESRILFWVYVHQRLLEVAKQNVGRILFLSYENLVYKPLQEIHKIAYFLGVKTINPEQILKHVEYRKNIGRGERLDRSFLYQSQRQVIAHFGYA